MTASPTVSVVMPSWNRAALVTDALASVTSQTYPFWEAVVVDDGSTDDTQARIAALGEPRIRVIASPHIGRPARLRNIGAAAARGEWIAFLDSDDRWVAGKLAAQVAALSQSGARWSYGDHALIDASGARILRPTGRFAPQSGRILAGLLAEETSAFIGTLVVERALFETLGGFDEALAMRDDLDFTLRLAAAADAVAIDEVLALVREHGGRTTRRLADPHAHSALVYERLIAREPAPSIVALAQRRLASIEADARRYRWRTGPIGRALRLLQKLVRRR